MIPNKALCVPCRLRLHSTLQPTLVCECECGLPLTLVVSVHQGLLKQVGGSTQTQCCRACTDSVLLTIPKALGVVGLCMLASLSTVLMMNDLETNQQIIKSNFPATLNKFGLLYNHKAFVLCMTDINQFVWRNCVLMEMIHGANGMIGL